MKVAVCFSGHMRTYDKTYQSLKLNLLDHYDTDIFIHTWSKSNNVRGKDFGKDDIDIEKEIKEIYKPKSLLIEPQKEFKLNFCECFNFARTNPHNVFSKMYSMSCVGNLLKEYQLNNDVQYDIVLSLRSDMEFLKPIKLIKEENKIFIPGNVRVPENTYHDYYAYGSSNIMQVYFNVYNEFDNICKKLNKFKPEKVLTDYIDSKNIEVKFCDLFYNLLRMNGDVLQMEYVK